MAPETLDARPWNRQQAGHGGGQMTSSSPPPVTTRGEERRGQEGDIQQAGHGGGQIRPPDQPREETDDMELVVKAGTKVRVLHGAASASSSDTHAAAAVSIKELKQWMLAIEVPSPKKGGIDDDDIDTGLRRRR